MKPKTLQKIDIRGRRILILSDGKPGHYNQAIAFARLLDCDFDVIDIAFRTRFAKICSYLFAWFGVYTPRLLTVDDATGCYAAVVSAGSGTYYGNRCLAAALQCSSVAIMMPRGYPLTFDLIVAQRHDEPPEKDNILTIPANLSYIEPKGLVTTEPGCRYVSFIIGGNSSHFQFDETYLEQQVRRIFDLFPEHRFWLTTSRRTPEAVERMLKKFTFDRAVFYSEEQVNPIPDFLKYSEYVFVTADSSSMISEAVSYGDSSIEILPPHDQFDPHNKFGRLIKTLADDGCLHVFRGSVDCRNEKINLGKILKAHLN